MKRSSGSRSARLQRVESGVQRVLATLLPRAVHAEAGLRSAAGFLRGEVGRQLGLRHAPRLEFVYDAELERAEKLSRLIDEAVATGNAPPASDRGEAGD